MSEITEVIPTIKNDKPHIGNIKLSETHKAIKLHIFNPEKFLVVPLSELNTKSGKVLEYIEGVAEVVGEITPPKKGSQKNLWTLKVFNACYYLRDNYITMFKNETLLTLNIYEE